MLLAHPSSRLVRTCRAVTASVWLLGPLAAGCLEANATTTALDGGSDTGHTTPSFDAGKTPHPDATVTDTGTPTTDSGPTTGHDAPAMSEAGMASTCLHPSNAYKACASCDEMMCASEITASKPICGSFYTCVGMCDCSDTSCVDACAMAASGSCQTDLENFVKCQNAMCTAACATDAGAPPDAAPSGDAGQSCKNPTQVQKDCAACDKTKCATEVSSANGACSTFYACFDNCACSDTTCIDNCAAAAPGSCLTALKALNTCQMSMCSATCSGSDGGTPKDAGTAGQIPDCMNPTPAEATTYAACSACDDMACASEVTSAVSACPIYNMCIASHDCSTAATACAGDLTGACYTAATALNNCQTANCLVACGF